ncbi:MAG TPA: hypothetical protein VGL54_01330 [Solirubrobacteraceae bacterium]|jgi:hypothetical protein
MTKSGILLVLTILVCALAVSAAPAFASNGYEGAPGPGFGGGGMGTHTFEFGSLTVKCEVSNFTGSQPTPATTVEEVPSYEKCKMLSQIITPTVKFCAYKLLEPTGGPLYEANMMIVKDGSSPCKMIFSVTGCTVTIEEQTPELLFLEAENVVPGAMKVFFHIHDIAYSHGGTGCTHIGSGSDGIYTGIENIEGLNVY